MKKTWQDYSAEELLREIRDRIKHSYQQTDGSFLFPNSAEGDLLKMVNVYIQNVDMEWFRRSAEIEGDSEIGAGWVPLHTFETQV